MPNWCNTSYAFYAAEENEGNLKKLYDKLFEVYNKKGTIKNDFGEGWLGDVLEAFGCGYEKIPCRGSIVWFDDYDADSLSFNLDTDTAWMPTTELWNFVCSQFEGVEFVYKAEEPGCGLYVNTDADGSFFSEKIMFEAQTDGIDMSKSFPQGSFSEGINPAEVYEDCRYFESFEELYKHFNKITGKEFNDIEEIKNYLMATMAAYLGVSMAECEDNLFINLVEYNSGNSN